MGTLLTNCLNALTASLADILLGKLSNARAVGLFSRANSTVALFTYAAGSTISYGAVSYLSQTHHRGESLAPTLGRSTALITGIAWPAYAFTAMLGHDIVSTLYGPKWLDCVPAMLPLAISAAISMLFQYTPAGLTAIGRPYLAALPASITLLTRIVFAFILFNGGLANFAWTIVAATVVTAPVLILQQQRYFGFGARALLASVQASAVVAIICMAACALLMLVVPATMTPLIRLLTLSVPLAAIWYGSLRLTHHELVAEVHHLAGSLRARMPSFG
jgi:O-antigen/teichoic acid export membrane protein